MKTSELQDILQNVKLKYEKSESWNKSLIKNEIQKVFRWVYCPRDNATRGIPDIWFTDIFGVLCVIELKKQDNKITPLQSWWLNKMAHRSSAFLIIIQKDNSCNIVKY